MSVQFKENTGFCINCRQFKLLVKNPHNTRSEYCIACDNDLEFRAMGLKEESRVMEGRWFQGQKERIQAHAERVQADLALMKQRRRAS